MSRETRLFLYKTEKDKYSADSMFFNVSERVFYGKGNEKDLFHWHDYFEMEFFFEGEGTHLLNGEEMQVGRGTIYLLTPADFHTLYKKDASSPLRYYNVNFNEYALPPEIIQSITEYDAPLTATLSESDCRYLRREFEYLVAEQHSEKEFRKQMICSCFEKIFIIFLRAFGDALQEKKTMQSKTDGNIRHIINYLHLHFREQISLSSAAKEVYLTPNYAGELFRREIGMSFTEYVQRLRLDYATNLLIHSDLSVSDICFQSGFRSVSYFIKIFKSANGTPPHEYRTEKTRAKK